MLATSTFTAPLPIGLRCAACRYFTLERCCNASARLDGAADRDGDCEFFRFVLSPTRETVWELR